MNLLLFLMTILSSSVHAESVGAPVFEVSSARLHLPENINEPKAPSGLSFTFSTYSPSRMHLPTPIGMKEGFSSPKIPALALDYVEPGLKRLKAFEFRAGVGFTNFERTGSFISGGTVIDGIQSVSLISIRFGADFIPQGIRHWRVAPILGATLSPTALVTGFSSIDKGSVRYGVPGDFALGARLRFNGGSFTVSARDAFTVSGSEDFGALAMDAGLKVDL